MPAKGRRGFCVTCGTTRSSSFRNATDEHVVRFTDGAKRMRKKPNQVCSACDKMRVQTAAPYPLASTIKNAGKGLFADRNYKYGEFVCNYGGRMLDGKPEKRSAYVIAMKVGGEIEYWDAKFNGDLGRYINDGGDSKNNCKFFVKDGQIAVKTVSKDYARTNLGHKKSRRYCVEAGEELFISYGSDYW